jgi:hypothetical protein
MPATPDDIAKYTNDGIVITAADASILSNHPEAEDRGEDVIDYFFVSASDAAVVLAERFNIQSQINGLHEAAVVEDSLGLGSTVQLSPTVPSFRLVDDERGHDVVLRTRAYAYEAGADQFSIELVA